jgi:hypothetical protein
MIFGLAMKSLQITPLIGSRSSPPYLFSLSLLFSQSRLPFSLSVSFSLSLAFPFLSVSLHPAFLFLPPRLPFSSFPCVVVFVSFRCCVCVVLFLVFRPVFATDFNSCPRLCFTLPVPLPLPLSLFRSSH